MQFESARQSRVELERATQIQVVAQQLLLIHAGDFHQRARPRARGDSNDLALLQRFTGNLFENQLVIFFRVHGGQETGEEVARSEAEIALMVAADDFREIARTRALDRLLNVADTVIVRRDGKGPRFQKFKI